VNFKYMHFIHFYYRITDMHPVIIKIIGEVPRSIRVNEASIGNPVKWVSAPV